MFINEKNQAVLFSYYSENGAPFGEPGQTRIAGYQTENEWKNILYWDKESTKIASNSGTIEKENYNDTLCLTITNDQGKSSFDVMANMFANPGIYNLLTYNCNTHTRDIVQAAGKFYDYRVVPNDSFNNTVLFYNNRRIWTYMNGINMPLY